MVSVRGGWYRIKEHATDLWQTGARWFSFPHRSSVLLSLPIETGEEGIGWAGGKVVDEGEGEVVGKGEVAGKAGRL